MRVVAKIPDTQMYLVSIGDILTPKTEGFIADLDRNVRFPAQNLQSLLARGYWERAIHSPELLKRLLALEEEDGD